MNTDVFFRVCTCLNVNKMFANDGNVTDAKLYTLHFHTLTKGDLVDLGWIDCSSANEYKDTASPLGSLCVSVI